MQWDWPTLPRTGKRSSWALSFVVCMNLRRDGWSEGTSMNRGSVSEAFSEALWLLQQSPISFPILSDFIQTVQGQIKILLCSEDLDPTRVPHTVRVDIETTVGERTGK